MSSSGSKRRVHKGNNRILRYKENLGDEAQQELYLVGLNILREENMQLDSDIQKLIFYNLLSFIKMAVPAAIINKKSYLSKLTNK